MKTILLKFSSPLQSWGTGSNFETRETDHHPSKAAVIGLIAGSMGYLRNDERIKKLNKISFAVRVDDQGNLLRDYHIAAKCNNKGGIERNYVTNRYYLEDAVFIVALSHEDGEFMDRVYKALQSPYYQPFLGRRSNPPTADFIIGIYESEPIGLLKEYAWQAREKRKRKAKNDEMSKVYVDIYADSSLIKSSQEKKRKDVVISFSQRNRQYSYRIEKRLTIELPVGNERSLEIDFFGQI